MKKILLILITIFLMSGCYNYKELNEMAIVSSIGIDKADDKYLVSAQIMNSKESEESDDSQIVVYEIKGKTIHEALRNLTLKVPSRLYGGHLSKLVLSEEVARDGIDDILDSFNRISEIRDEFIITIVKDDKASDVLKVLTSSETVPAEYVKSSLKTADLNSALTYGTKFDEFVSLYLKKGIDPTIPILKIDKKSKKGDTIDNVTTTDPPSKIVLDGMAITSNGKLEDFLSDSEIIGYNYIRDQVQQMVIPVKCDDNNYSSVSVQKSKTKSSVKKVENKYTITFNVDVNAIITEYNCAKDLTKENNIKNLEEKTSKKIKNYMKKAVEKQGEVNSKFLGLERTIYLDYPKYNNEDYSIKYKVNVNLVRKGEIRNSIKGAKN